MTQSYRAFQMAASCNYKKVQKNVYFFIIALFLSNFNLIIIDFGGKFMKKSINFLGNIYFFSFLLSELQKMKPQLILVLNF